MKNLLCVTIVALVLAGCVKDEASDVANQEKQRVTFDSPVLYSNMDTKANVYGEIESFQYSGQHYSYPREEDFVIYGVSHSGDFKGWADEGATPVDFNDKAISYDESIDGWAPKTDGGGYYYWEDGMKMSFAASSPAELEQGDSWQGSRTYGATGLIIEDFSIAGDASKQYDLLFSKRVCNQTSADMSHVASYYSGIPITFYHALSSIRFSILKSDNAEVILKSITLEGLKYKGTFKENITENTGDYSQYERETNVKPGWTVEEDIITTPYTAFSGDIVFPHDGARYVSQLVDDAKNKGINTNICNQLLLMPQELPANAKLIIKYTVNGAENTKTVTLKEQKTSSEHSSLENNTTGAGKTIDKWEIGKRYTYRLLYSTTTADKDKIYFAPKTEQWEDVNIITTVH